VISPHAKELDRMINWGVREIDENRYSAALEGAKRSGCHVLLKGFRSVLAYENRCMVIQSGNSSLAKAGTGDVLAGMIGALLAQGMDTLQGSATAAFLHGKLADEWVRRGLDKSSLMPSDLTNELPSLLARTASSVIF
jgi:NAD(P)H-hydrate epimerase